MAEATGDNSGGTPRRRTVKQLLESLLNTTLDDANDPNVSTKCFCHDDSSNSLSIRTDNGLWYCHTTGKGGNLITAVATIKKISNGEARTLLEGEGFKVADAGQQPDVKLGRTEEDDAKAPEIAEPINGVYVQNLSNNQAIQLKAEERMGWREWALQKYGIGYDLGTKRFTIPVRDTDGKLKNIRMYDPDADGEMKTISFSDRGKVKYGAMRLWPEERPSAQRIILVEGEKDCILTNQMIAEAGIADTMAVTGTGGAGSWRDYWNDRFKGKDVIVAYDCDKAGREAAEKRALDLQLVAGSVRILDLGLPNKGDDITDYFHREKKTWADFEQLVEESAKWTKRTKRTRPEKPKDEKLYTPHLSEASAEDFLYKQQELRVIVAGKDLSPFAVPRKVTMECDMGNGKACQGCALFANNGVLTTEYAEDDPNMIKFVNVTDKDAIRQVKEDAGVVKTCPRVETDVEEHQNLEEVTLIPEIDFAEEDREYVSRTAYLTTHGIQPNKVYVMRGTTLPHPKTHHVIHFIKEVEPAQDSIDDFNMTPELLNQLKVFQPTNGQSVGDKFDQIADDLTHNVTEIWGRQDLIKGIDLCYHSVLAFDFQGKAVAKAWGDIIGDTRTGKSETIIATMRHYRAGEMVDGENATLAGIVGGVRQEAGKRWSVRWGRMALNDRRLLCLEEASGLDLETIGKMSGIRSNGIADLAKIEGQRTMARTRLIMNSNPRSAKSMSAYAHGIDAVKELIGRPEDISRFDLVLTAATNEVPLKEINMAKADRTPIPHVFTSELCHQLVLWAWSRKSENIEFTPDATARVLYHAQEQAGRYASSGGAPLVEGGNHRIKLAKLAVAAACRTFSTPDGEKVIVTPDHVDFVAAFLDELYAKPSLDYAGFSEQVLNRINVPDAKKDETRDWIRNHGDWAELWLRHDQLRVDDFRTQFDLTMEECKSDIFKPLARLNMVERASGSTYVKTPPFIALIKEIRESEGLNTQTPSAASPQPAAVGGGNYQADIDSDDIPF